MSTEPTKPDPNTIRQTVGNFERILSITPAYDKRSAEPSKNYGIHGMDMRFVLKGPLGAMQFVFYTNVYPKHVQQEHKARGYVAEWMGADIGYHSPVAMYDGQEKMPCDLFGECFYDGTSLGAAEFAPAFVVGGPDAVWRMLEERYMQRFAIEGAA